MRLLLFLLKPSSGCRRAEARDLKLGIEASRRAELSAPRSPSLIALVPNLQEAPYPFVPGPWISGLQMYHLDSSIHPTRCLAGGKTN